MLQNKTLCRSISRSLKAKKLVSVSATSTSMTGPKKKALECIFCIYYPIQSKKDIVEVQALIDLRSKVNTIAPACVKKPGFWLQKTNIRAQKIDGSNLKTYIMVIVGLRVQDLFEKARFF